MALRADFQKSYSMRYALIAGVCLFLSLWFLYDGVIGYPSQREIAAEYETLSDLDTMERATRWREIANDRGWPTEKPEETAEEVGEKITGQFVFAGLAFCVGFPASLLYFRTRGSWVEATETGLTTSWGQSMDFSQVTTLNKRKWADKGIAKARYNDNGTAKIFTFDDFKFAREPLGKILRDLEATLKPDQIVGGPSEADAEKDRKNDETPSNETLSNETLSNETPSSETPKDVSD